MNEKEINIDWIIILLCCCVVLSYSFLFSYELADPTKKITPFFYDDTEITVATYWYFLQESIINTLESIVYLFFVFKIEYILKYISIGNHVNTLNLINTKLLKSVFFTYFAFRITDIFTYISIYDRYDKRIDISFVFAGILFFLFLHKKKT